MIRNIRGVVATNEASSLIEVALILPVLLLMLVGAVDFGRGYFEAMEVSSAAESGALYGSFNPSDTSGMVTAAKLDAKEVSTMAAVASYGCECSDGSSATASCLTTPTCTNDVVNYVEVDTSVTYTPFLSYPGIPSSFVLSGKGRMRAGN